MSKATAEEIMALLKDPQLFLADARENPAPIQVATIREAECIGCTKCIQACPVDAILGSAKHMHTILTDECTGCELCIAPCPVDCIEMVPTAKTLPDATLQTRAIQFSQRYHARLQRLQQNNSSAQREVLPLKQSPDEKKLYIAAAIMRAKIKKNSSS